ncbi:FNTA [Acanthosepion pharaonis]|uniref:Protein farnesyltransferase/geranylgeranyltransferase type-1 subunit alpha n=1 Tax=Acanthosepion pharaonis TaxID=158019 RepID=A0A812E4Q9_ACAPH|nr:FNTA [Sepia pharaonis]
MYVCMYLSMYVCMYLSMYVSIYLSIYVCMYLSMYLSIYLSIYVCMYLSMYLCMYVSIYVSMYVCIYLSMYVCIYLSIYLCMYVSIYLCMYVCIYLSMYVCMYLCMYVSIYLSIYVYAKNYHAWQHRQWVLKTYSLWDKELNYVDKLLSLDLRNNSAWNHRYFVICNTSKYTDEVIESEINYTWDYIEQTPHNESAWNYLKGVLMLNGLREYPQVLEKCLHLYDKNCRSPYLLACLIDIYEDQLETNPTNQKQILNKALELCELLAEEHDLIRQEYWRYISQSLSTEYGSPEEKVKADNCGTNMEAA